MQSAFIEQQLNFEGYKTCSRFLYVIVHLYLLYLFFFFFLVYAPLFSPFAFLDAEKPKHLRKLDLKLAGASNCCWLKHTRSG